MALTGGAFLTTVALATLAAFVAVVVLWPRLGGPGWTRVALRAGSLVVVNALVLLTAAVQLNDTYLFFADWTDLHGAMTGKIITTSVSGGGNARSAAARAVSGERARPVATLPPLPTGTVGGQVLSFHVSGPLSHLKGTIYVALPPSYNDPAGPATYPVIETFNGYPGSPRQWIDSMQIQNQLAAEVSRHQMREVLVVSPQTEFPPGVDTECVNGRPGNPQVETWLARDVPNWVAQHFRVSTERSSWATLGFSAGGWCAAMVAMLHPSQYAAAIVLGGYFRPYFGPYYEPYPTHSAMAQRYDLIRLAGHRPPAIAMWVETSHSDTTSYTTSAELLHAARAPLAISAVVLRHAGHRVALWRQLEPRALDWLGQQVSGFAPLA